MFGNLLEILLLCDVRINMDSGMARYINPFTDVGFKRIFGQE